MVCFKVVLQPLDYIFHLCSPKTDSSVNLAIRFNTYTDYKSLDMLLLKKRKTHKPYLYTKKRSFISWFE